MLKKKEKKEVAIIPEDKVAEISKDIKSFEKKAEKYLAIKTQVDYENTTSFIVDIKGRINRIKEIVEFFTKPHQDARKKALDDMRKVEALFASSLSVYEGIETRIKSAMSGWQREQDRLARAEEDRLAKLREKREERTGNIDPTPLPTIERATPTVATDNGKSVAKKSWKFQVEAYSKLPQNVVDEVMYQAKEKGLIDSVIRKMVQAGTREMSGVRIYEDFDISVQA